MSGGFSFGRFLSRRFGWGKKVRWFLQRKLSDPDDEVRIVTRNNAMRFPIEFVEDVNVLHATVLYVSRNDEVFLSYATADLFAIVLYLNIGLSPERFLNRFYGHYASGAVSADTASGGD